MESFMYGKRGILAVVVGVLMVGLLPWPVGAQGALDRNDDSSGNGFDLVETNPGQIVDQNGTVQKFGNGVNQTDGAGPGTGLKNTTNDDFATGGDLSFTIAMDVGDGPNGEYFAINDSDRILYQLDADLDGNVTFRYDDGTFPLSTCQVETGRPLGFASVWGRIDVGGALTDTIVQLRAFDENGTITEDVSCSFGPEPDSTGTLGEFWMLDFSGTQSVGIYEMRWFTELIPTERLDAIADPTDERFTAQGEGRESVLYLLEPVLLGESAPEQESRVAIHGPSQIDGGENVTFHAFVFNASAFPVVPEEGMDLGITRIEPSTGPQWFNASSQVWSSVPVVNEMSPLGTSPATFSLAVQFPTSEDSQVALVAFAEIGASRPQPGASLLNVTGAHQVTVSPGSDVATQSHETELFQVTQLTPFELALFPAMAFVGVILWSRTTDLVVRVFGASLPLAAGLLLITFGNVRGFGNLWDGHVAFALAHLLLGLYMVIREFYDQVAGDAREVEA